jgi:uncharacterized protein (TIGR02300 family)
MPNEEWGVKRACPKCTTRFYDLNADPMICPSCAHSFTQASLLEALRGRKAKTEDAPAKTVDDADDVDLLDDEADDVDADDELLEDDDDETVSLDDIADVASTDDES